MLVSLAGKVFDIRTENEDIKTFFSDYEVNTKADFLIECHEDQIFECMNSLGTSSLYYGELTAIHTQIAELLPKDDSFLFHASAIAYKGEAVLFAALSGTGKSTHAALWKKLFKEEVFYVNDDKPFIRIRDDGAYVYGGPWNGKGHLSTNTAVRIRAVVLLERGQNNRIVAINKKEAYPRLLMQTYKPKDKIMSIKTLDLLEAMMSKVSLYRLTCNMEDEAAEVACESIFGNVKR